MTLSAGALASFTDDAHADGNALRLWQRARRHGHGDIEGRLGGPLQWMIEAMIEAMIEVEVVAAFARRQEVASLQVPSGTTAMQAVMRSGLLDRFPGLEDAGPGGGVPDVGVFGRRVAPECVLHDGDRVEIYRLLEIDPKAARRARAALNAGASRVKSVR